MDNPVAEVTTQLFELYSDEIYRYALFVLGSANDAQDTVQEVFTRVFNSWDTFRHDSNPRTWIWSITRNYLSDLKRRKKIPTIALDATLSQGASLSSHGYNSRMGGCTEVTVSAVPTGRLLEIDRGFVGL